MGQQIELKNVQITWPTLFAPKTSKAFPSNAPTYGVQPILKADAHAKEIAQIKAAMDAVNAEMFERNPREYPKSWRTPKPNGDIHLRASSPADKRPQLADAKANKVLVDQGEFYPGAVCNVYIEVFGTSNHGGKICVGLLGVQKVRDGERIDGAPTHDDLFAPIAVTGSPAASADPLG